MKRATAIVIFVICSCPLLAKKTVAGVKFAACLNDKKLPADFYRGKFLILDFWATWCGPCIASFTRLEALRQKYQRDKRIVFAAMSAEPAGRLDTFFHKKKDMLPGVLHLADKDGATWQCFGINEIPRIIVFNPYGKMVFSGEITQLMPLMDKILSGADLITSEKEPAAATVDKWKQYWQAAGFVAFTGAADSTGALEGSFISHDFSEARFEESDVTLLDMIATFGNLTTVAMKTNDTAQAARRIMFCYKQKKSDFPEFDSGIFSHQYQNHMLHILEGEYSFRCHWITEGVHANRIVIADSAKLAAAGTISEKGSYCSRSAGRKLLLTNQTLATIAGLAEDGFKLPFTTCSSTVCYDMEIDLSSYPAFEKSLANYGLAIMPVDNYQMRKLEVDFQ